MKRTTKSLIALLVLIAMCVSFCVPTFAEVTEGGHEHTENVATGTACPEKHSETNCDYEVVEVITASCGRDGYTLAKCKACQKEFIFGVKLKPNDHDYVNNGEAVAPKCEKTDEGYTLIPGSQPVKCSICGDEKEIEIKADENVHVWSEPYLQGTDNPCTPEGAVYVKKCSVCETIVEVSKEQYDEHEWVLTGKDQPSVCVNDGWVEFACAHCGETKIVVIESQIEKHTWEEVSAENTTVEPTHNTTGLAVVSCTKCDATNEVEIATINHEWKKVAAKAATCTESGNELYYTCECDKLATKSGDAYIIIEAIPTIPAKGHNTTTTTVIGNCTTYTVTTTKCSECDYEDTDIGTEYVHSYAEEPTTSIDSTCAKYGWNTYACVICGDEDAARVERIDLKDHNFGSEEDGTEIREYITQGVLCTEASTYVCKCLDCGAKSEEKTIPAKDDHNWKTTVYRATCVEEGYTLKECLDCDVEDVKTDEKPIDPNYHADGEEGKGLYDEVTPATCEQNGQGIYYCQQCNTAKTVTIPGGHNYEEVKVEEATCGTPKKVYYECSKCDAAYDEIQGNENGHGQLVIIDSKPATCLKAAWYKYGCPDCATEVDGELVYAYTEEEGGQDISNHNMEGSLTQLPNCKGQKAGTWYTCTVCNDYEYFVEDETVVFDKLNPEHHYVDGVYGGVKQTITHENGTVSDYYIDGTCTVEGQYQYKCSFCAETYLVSANDGSGKGHDADKIEKINVIPAIEATCKIEGFTEGYQCKFCDFKVVPQSLGKLDHTPVVDKAVAATCEDTGLTEGSHCDVCGDTIVAQEKTDKLGHKFENYTANGDANCSSVGTKTAKCIRCDVTDTKAGDAVDATKHNFVTYVSNNDATCLEDGTKTAVCEWCEDVKDTVADEDSALGHLWIGTNGEQDKVVVPASCTEKGYIIYSCLRCTDKDRNEENDRQYIVSYEDAKGHTRETLKAVEATCTTEGLTAGEWCSVCKTVFVEQQNLGLRGYHVKDGVEIKETCVAGNSDLTGELCDDCGKTIKKEHANQETKIEEANCYSDGYKLVYCTVCNYREVEIYAEKVDHAYTKQVTEIEPSVGATGLAYMHCQYCDLKGTEPEHKIVLDAIEGVHFFYEIVNVNGGSVIANSNTINVIISTKASGISLTGISLKLGYSTDVITFVSGEFCNAQFDAENVIITSPDKANAQQSVTIVANLKANETFYGEDEFAVLTFKVNDVVAEDAIIDLEVIAEGSNATNVEAEDGIEGVNFGTGAEAAIVRLGYLAGGTNITVADAQKIANIEGTLDEDGNLLYNVAADIDKDGEITLADYGYLRQYLAGNLTYAELCAIGTSTEA